MIEHIEKMIKEFNMQGTDTKRFTYMIEHPKIFQLFLENAYTGISLSDEISENLTKPQIDVLTKNIIGFDSYIGRTDGVMHLLNALKIKWMVMTFNQYEHELPENNKVAK